MDPKDTPPPRGRSYGRQAANQRDDSVSNAVIFRAIGELKEQIGGLQDRMDGLPDAFIPRREAGEINDRMKDRQNDHAARITELEKWRLQWMEQQHQSQLATLAQVQAGQLTTTTQVAQAQVTTTNQAAATRDAQDNRMINALWGGLLGVGTTVLGFILSHILH